MPYPFHLLKNEKIPAPALDVETCIRHTLGKHLFIVEKLNLDETNRRFNLHFWQRHIGLDRHLDNGERGKIYWGGAEIIEWSDSTEIVQMWAATPEDWYIGKFLLDKEKVMEERFGWLEELSNEIRAHFTQPASESQNVLQVRGVETFGISKKQEVPMSNNSEKNSNDTKRNVFVVHGRNETLRRSVFDFLRAIGLNPIEWTKAIAMTGKGSPFIGDILDKAMEQAQAIVVLFTGDDEAKLRDEFQNEHDPEYEKELTPQPRPNVLFEAGMAFGKYPERTILVQVGSMRPFSDIAGRHLVHITNSMKSRQDLALRLQNAGCSVDLRGTDWHSAGKFSIPKEKKEKVKGTKPEPEIKKQVSAVEKVSKESNLPVEALNILVAFTSVPTYMSIGISVDVLAQLTGNNPLRTKKYCELLESRDFVTKESSIVGGENYSITNRGEAFLLETGLA